MCPIGNLRQVRVHVQQEEVLHRMKCSKKLLHVHLQQVHVQQLFHKTRSVENDS